MYKLTIGILGSPGVGKSSFINSLIGVDIYLKNKSKIIRYDDINNIVFKDCKIIDYSSTVDINTINFIELDIVLFMTDINKLFKDEDEIKLFDDIKKIIEEKNSDGLYIDLIIVINRCDNIDNNMDNNMDNNVSNNIKSNLNIKNVFMYSCYTEFLKNSNFRLKKNIDELSINPEHKKLFNYIIDMKKNIYEIKKEKLYNSTILKLDYEIKNNREEPELLFKIIKYDKYIKFNTNDNLFIKSFRYLLNNYYDVKYYNKLYPESIKNFVINFLYTNKINYLNHWLIHYNKIIRDYNKLEKENNIKDLLELCLVIPENILFYNHYKCFIDEFINNVLKNSYTIYIK